MENYLKTYSQDFIAELISVRDGEQKLGEVISYGNDYSNELINYVILGIPEDIGPIANFGKPGAKNGWSAFLKSFLNTQNNRYINPNQIHVLGEIITEDLYEDINENSTPFDYQKLVEKLDIRVFECIKKIKASGKIPIVIGGGHNNCYPIIKGCSEATNTKLNILNIDPHADLRALEGRHSGNGFSYALNENFIAKYFILGLHEEYNSEYILSKIKENKNISYYSYNSYIKSLAQENELVNSVSNFITSKGIGLEIDLDSIANMPVSAKTPSGFSVESLRKIIISLTSKYNFEYIHICEGAPQNEDEKIIVGKTISYLVNDIIKENLNH